MVIPPPAPQYVFFLSFFFLKKNNTAGISIPAPLLQSDHLAIHSGVFTELQPSSSIHPNPQRFTFSDRCVCLSHTQAFFIFFVLPLADEAILGACFGLIIYSEAT